jgi:hypothetical protein
MEADGAADLNAQRADRQMWRQCIGYGCVGLGAPSLFAGFTLIRFVFLPSRSGRVMAAFRWDHPAFVTGALLLLLGAALVVPGVLFIRLNAPPSHGHLTSNVAQLSSLPAGETYTRSRAKIALALVLLLAITVWLGLDVLQSTNVLLKYGVGLPYLALMAFVLACGILGMVKPQKLELDTDGVSLSLPWRGKILRLCWKDVAEVKALTGPYANGIWLSFPRPDARGRYGYYLPAGWEGIGRADLLARMEELRKSGGSDAGRSSQLRTRQ